ncbi:hypothetical protein WMF20_50070 [Sorangium sp. So ce834]|uniref:hypothetical protein n=1 Tax=Sorangium sp. So ce834 TaxID=3133321 RepID=UPI003F6449C0
MSRGACIAAIGAVSAIGDSAVMTAVSARARISGVREHPYMVDRAGQPLKAALARYIDVDAEPELRVRTLLERAVAPCAAAWPAGAGALEAVLGCAEVGRPGLPPGLGEGLSEALSAAAGGAISTVIVERRGHAAGLLGVARALGRVALGGAEACLVAAVDSYAFPDTLDALDRMGRLRSAHNAWGFVPGEAAGACLLCSERFAARWRLPVLGRVVSAGTAEEQALPFTEGICTGAGLTRAVRAALEGLHPDALVDEVVCDFNGARYRADEMGFLVARLPSRLAGGSPWAPAASWGDIGAASGLLAITTACVLAERAFPRGPNVLVWASSDDGARGAVLLHLPVSHREV